LIVYNKAQMQRLLKLDKQENNDAISIHQLYPHPDGQLYT